MPKTAMILAAGEGTRLKPLTDDIPKAMVTFHSVPMIEIIIRKLVRAGFTRLIINVYHLQEQIIKFVSDNDGFGAEIFFSREDMLMDTGGGIKKAASLLGKDPVLFHNVDILTSVDLGRFYSDHLKWNGMASLAIKERPTSRNLLFDRNLVLCGWHHPENRIKIVSRNSRGGYYETAFSGIYILDPSAFDLFPEEDVFSLTPWLIELSGKHEIRGWDHNEDYWFDLGTPIKLNRAEEMLMPDPDNPVSFILR